MMSRRVDYKKKIMDTIADATLELLERKPFEHIKIDEIMKISGFTKGTFYAYFDRKESLLEYLIDKANEIFRMMLIHVQDNASDEIQALSMLLDGIFEEKARKPVLWVVFSEAAIKQNMLRLRLLDRLKAFIHMFGGHPSDESAMLLFGSFLCIWTSEKITSKEEWLRLWKESIFMQKK